MPTTQVGHVNSKARLRFNHLSATWGNVLSGLHRRPRHIPQLDIDSMD
jgi:hypothetical protein